MKKQDSQHAWVFRSEVINTPDTPRCGVFSLGLLIQL